MKKLLLVATLCGALSGCGFHLRGYGESQTFAFQKICVPAVKGVLLVNVLKGELALHKELSVVPDIAGADAVLKVDQEYADKEVFTVDKTGAATQYLVIYRARFSLKMGGNEVIEPTMLQLRRALSWNATEVLAKDGEVPTLVSDMRADMAQQIIRRLAAVKPMDRTMIPASLMAPEPVAPVSR